tara:strand:+ start:108633 stop:110771 length:2139 start_codon:yes stop_codon:yes gene_type:complete
MNFIRKKLKYLVGSALLVGCLTVSYGAFRTFKIGEMWDTFHDSSAHPWQRGWQFPLSWFMVWPGGHNYSRPAPVSWNTPHPVNSSASSYWIGAKPWTNEAGTTFPDGHVSEVGWWFWDDSKISIPRYIKKYTKRTHPEVYVDGKMISDLWPEAPGDEIDGNLVSDQMIENAVRTDIGVDILQKAYAFTNSNFDNLSVIDVTFTNTGNIDLDDDVELAGQTLTDVYISYSIRPTISRHGHNHAGGMGEWVQNEFSDYVGEEAGDPFRLMYAWDGDNKANNAFDDYGDPHPNYGAWLSSGFTGQLTLHADTDASNTADDLSQPASTRYEGFASAPSGSKAGNGIDKMYEFMTLGHKGGSWEADPNVAGHEPTWLGGDGMSDPNWHGENQINTHMVYGPFDLGPNEDYRVIFVRMINGLDRKTIHTEGLKWHAAITSGDTNSYTWTDPTTGTSYSGTLAKNHYLSTGRDSLFRDAQNVLDVLYANNMNVPDPPMSPSLFVKSSGGGIDVSWSDEPRTDPDPDTGVLDFEGYRLYRAVARWDSTNFEMVYEGTANEYLDTGVPAGVGAYYYVTAYDDGTQNTWGVKPGQKLESSRWWSYTTVPAYTLVKSESDLSQVDVIPNPYNIRAVDNQYPGDPNKLVFANLTPYAKIRVFTMTGDHVATIDHTDGSGQASWDQVSKDNQYIVSGVYIYYVEETDENGTPSGDTATGKFIVVR